MGTQSRREANRLKSQELSGWHPSALLKLRSHVRANALNQSSDIV